MQTSPAPGGVFAFGDRRSSSMHPSARRPPEVWGWNRNITTVHEVSALIKLARCRMELRVGNVLGMVVRLDRRELAFTEASKRGSCHDRSPAKNVRSEAHDIHGRNVDLREDEGRQVPKVYSVFAALHALKRERHCRLDRGAVTCRSSPLSGGLRYSTLGRVGR